MMSRNASLHLILSAYFLNDPKVMERISSNSERSEAERDLYGELYVDPLRAERVSCYP